MRRPFALLAGVLLAGACALPAHAAPASAADGSEGSDNGFTMTDPRITESSGLAASRLHPGVYWTHNDSDDGPYVYAVDGKSGKTLAMITLRGIGAPRDVEAISIGPGNQMYVGDIGDNFDGRWPYVWIYQLPEPKELKDQTITAKQYVVKYTDGPRNAESMVVHPVTGRVYLIDKKEDGGHLYEGPAHLSVSGTNLFRPIAPVDLWATDAAFSPNGQQLAVRGYFGGIYYDWNNGRPKRVDRLNVPLQRQGESITYSLDGKKLLYGSEGEGSSVVAQDAPAGAGSVKSPSGERSSGSDQADEKGGVASGGRWRTAVVAVGVAALLWFGIRRTRRRG
ncbi:WD40 repeat domain-containing protein [Streptomyces sp. J2-1]|uniref:WD40 repeat domain-containing protein n=1 Tax=Streptomyces corallincola TaxID=2851888 RepID=UPI001C382766|nr:WD40 repeat domain-containing protein [Streptomyces corallincola]MBV2357445.1 WD40 repeat domain-containing protein [Streptomyces corallincola]